MAMTKCRECKKEVSNKATTCPHCGIKKPDESKGCLIITIVLATIFIPTCAALQTPQRQLTPQEQQKIDLRKAERQKERSIKEAEDKRQGLHCLSAWDHSHLKFERDVKSTMRDPDSFEHIKTRVKPVSKKGTHEIFMDYRARNGFGGMEVGLAYGIYKNSDCTHIILHVQ